MNEHNVHIKNIIFPHIWGKNFNFWGLAGPSNCFKMYYIATECIRIVM